MDAPLDAALGSPVDAAEPSATVPAAAVAVAAAALAVAALALAAATVALAAAPLALAAAAAAVDADEPPCDLGAVLRLQVLLRLRYARHMRASR